MMMMGKCFPICDKFEAEHKAEYNEYLAIAKRLQSRSARPLVSAEDLAKAQAFAQKMTDAGVEAGAMQILDRPFFN